MHIVRHMRMAWGGVAWHVCGVAQREAFVGCHLYLQGSLAFAGLCLYSIVVIFACMFCVLSIVLLKQNNTIV